MNTIKCFNIPIIASCLLAFFVGCSENNPEVCQQDTECPSGKICLQNRCQQAKDTCQSNGDCEQGKICRSKRCRDPLPGCTEPPCDQESAEERAKEETITPDAASPETSVEGPAQDDNQPKICRPNRDGQIQRDELLFKVGSSAVYGEAGSSNQPVQVDLKGSKDKDGETLWDFSKKFPGQTRVIDELLSPKGTWYEKNFKEPTYSTFLDRSLDLLGVYKTTDTELQLLGQVSRKANQVKVVGDKPAVLMSFPLKVGKKWTSQVTSTGSYQLAPFRSQETYEFEVDAKGKLKLSIGTYPVLRIRLKFTQQQYLPALLRRTRYTYFFVSECIGILSIVDSKYYESNAVFTQAAKLKKMTD